MEFASVCSSANVDLNEQCMSATLQTLQVVIIWHAAIALASDPNSQAAMQTAGLWQTPAIEGVIRCYAVAGHFSELLVALRNCRRSLLDRLASKIVFMRCRQHVSWGGRGGHINAVCSFDLLDCSSHLIFHAVAV